MRDLLLDSHVLLWLVADPSKLGSQCQQVITDADTVHVSAVTHAELRIKEMIGKLDLPEDLAGRLEGQGLTHVPFRESHATAMSDFPELARHDPFDRMLLAQAQAERLTFVTADRVLLALERSWILDARA